jgi:predicted phage replisome organizer
MNLSFIKLDINIMDDSKIKYIVKLPDGDKLFRLWVGLLCLGMKSGRPGIIEIGDNIPFTTEMLANHFDMELNTVK